MIAVSNEFKKAIKESERRIKGYVEVLYDVEDVNVSVTSNMTSSYTELSDITQGGRVKQNYGTLDYLPLDGSCLTMDTSNNEDSGFISDDLSGTETGRTFTLNFSSTTLNGITIYYKNNLPDGTYLTFSDGTTGYIEAPEDTGNEIYMQQYIFDTPKTLTSITIEYNLWRYETRKVKIPRIDLGVSAVYKDQDLIEFTVDEEVNKLVEEVPTNETNVTLNNIYDLFNPLNPQGVVKYLTDGSKIIPYIGVLTETQGVEFVKMGEFYFDSYTNNSDKSTTLVGKNVIKKLETDEITDGLLAADTFIYDNREVPGTLDILNLLPYNFEFHPRQPISYMTQYLDDINLLNYLRNLAFRDYSILYADRNNTIYIKDPISNVVDTLTKNELLEDVSYNTINRVNTIKRIANRPTTERQSDEGTTTIFNSTDNTFILTKPIQNFAVKNDYRRNVTIGTPNFTYSGVSSASIKFGSNAYTIIQAIGNVGDIASFNCTMNYKFTSKEGSDTYKVTNKKDNELEVALESTSWFNTYPGRVRTDLGQLEYTPSYEINFEYNGDPSLEAGDYIEVETPYGYKPVFIQKNRFTFNGGLSGSIEGVE